MNVTDCVSPEFSTLDAAAPVSKLAGAFEDPTRKAVVVTDDGDYEGVVTRRQLAASHRHPDAKVRSLVERVPRTTATTGVREAARLMVESGSMALPAFDGDRLRGVVEADGLLREVQPSLSALAVEDVYSDDLRTLAPDATLGRALHLFREHRIAHLPVVDDDAGSHSALVGIVSLTDVVDFATRDVRRSRGGSAGPFAGGPLGGSGAREGETDRLLDLPVRDVMTAPVGTVSTDRPLDAALDRMFDREASSLVVTTDDGAPAGIVTKTDLLGSLTMESPDRRSVQIVGVGLLGDVDYDEVSDLVAGLVGKGGDLTLIEAKVHLHEHDETRRGTPLLFVRVRLFTDDGLFVASGEGFGARSALHAARDALERQLTARKKHRENGERSEGRSPAGGDGW
ncbi:CBS domain-containing protein [Halegenticoccus tardaugens]|uniref:CBS domain-containing protein n=1 Tax=Halegenticoccus tardaugens TaxID=2071624 RepID=UPI00100B3C77|nr:CBS domain-containing protein [Halegenticoccus tardaugens]